MSHRELQLPCGGGGGGDGFVAESSIVTRGISGRCPFLDQCELARLVIFCTILIPISTIKLKTSTPHVH